MSCFNRYTCVWNVPDQGHVMMLHESAIYKVAQKIQRSKFSMGHLPPSNVYGTLT